MMYWLKHERTENHLGPNCQHGIATQRTTEGRNTFDMEGMMNEAERDDELMIKHKLVN